MIAKLVAWYLRKTGGFWVGIGAWKQRASLLSESEFIWVERRDKLQEDFANVQLREQDARSAALALRGEVTRLELELAAARQEADQLRASIADLGKQGPINPSAYLFINSTGTPAEAGIVGGLRAEGFGWNVVASGAIDAFTQIIREGDKIEVRSK